MRKARTRRRLHNHTLAELLTTIAIASKFQFRAVNVFVDVHRLHHKTYYQSNPRNSHK